MKNHDLTIRTKVLSFGNTLCAAQNSARPKSSFPFYEKLYTYHDFSKFLFIFTPLSTFDFLNCYLNIFSSQFFISHFFSSQFFSSRVFFQTNFFHPIFFIPIFLIPFFSYFVFILILIFSFSIQIWSNVQYHPIFWFVIIFSFNL